MKTLIIAIITGVITLGIFPTQADARPKHNHYSSTYRSGHTSCGCATYTKRVLVGYDCYRQPVFRYYRVPVKHQCRSHVRRTSYYSGKRGYTSSRISFNTGYDRVNICR